MTSDPGSWSDPEVLDAVDALGDTPATPSPDRGDVRSGEVYLLTEEIRTALKVALLTGRPLLLGGPPGCGKSSLAAYVARGLRVAYHEFITTDDVRASDLSWRLDAVRRLGDAQADKLDGRTARTSVAPYLEPGPLWWALDSVSARRRGLDAESAIEPAAPPQHLARHEPTRPGAVLLIDEIDKADSAFCNGLLVPLGSRQIFVPGLDLTVWRAADGPPWSPLTIITTNNERDLPEAFLRRCVVLRLPGPDAERLKEIVRAHFPADMLGEGRLDLLDTLAGKVGAENARDGIRPVSAAEFLDLATVIRALEPETLDETTIQTIMRITLEKHGVYEPQRQWWSE